MVLASFSVLRAVSLALAAIRVHGPSDAEVMWFRADAMLFTDRICRLTECPAARVGDWFLKEKIR